MKLIVLLKNKIPLGLQVFSPTGKTVQKLLLLKISEFQILSWTPAYL